MNTERLVRRCQGGDQAAWNLLVRRYSGYVHAVLTRAFGLTREQADEVFQLVWMRVYARVHTLKDDAALRPWIRQVTLNVTRDHLAAARRRREEVLVDEVGPYLGDQAELAELDEALDVHELLDALPERCTEILARRFVNDEKYATIAAALGMTTGQVSGSIHRCLGRLRELVARTDGAAAGV